MSSGAPFTCDGKQLEVIRQKEEPVISRPLGIGVGPLYGQYFFPATSIGQEIKGKLYVPGEDRYDMQGFFAVGPNYGKFSVYVGGQYIGTVNAYSESYHPAKLIKLGSPVLKEGEHELLFRIEGKDEKSTGMDFGIIAWQCSPITAPLIRKWQNLRPVPVPPKTAAGRYRSHPKKSRNWMPSIRSRSTMARRSETRNGESLICLRMRGLPRELTTGNSPGNAAMP